MILFSCFFLFILRCVASEDDHIGCYYHGSQISLRNYNGTQNVTTSGKPCLVWSNHSLTSALPNEHHNYCRLPPKSEAKKPWCYYITLEKTNFWEHCDVPNCKDGPQCANENDREQMIVYRGNVSHSEDGTPCLPWNTPKMHHTDPAITHNECRLPTQHDDFERNQTWCYVSTDKKTEYYKYCRVPSCIPMAIAKFGPLKMGLLDLWVTDRELVTKTTSSAAATTNAPIKFELGKRKKAFRVKCRIGSEKAQGSLLLFIDNIQEESHVIKTPDKDMLELELNRLVYENDRAAWADKKLRCVFIKGGPEPPIEAVVQMEIKK